MTDTATPRVRSEATVPPVPSALLEPLLDLAAEIVIGLDEPPEGMDLHADELLIAPSSEQLRRAVEVDAGFRRRVCAEFLERDDDAARLVDGWRVDAALEQVTIAHEDGLLALLVSALYAGRPTGWGYGLGAACAIHAGRSGAPTPADGAGTDEIRAALELAEQAEDAARRDRDARRSAEEARDRARTERDALAVRLADLEHSARGADDLAERLASVQADHAATEARAVELSGRIGVLERQVAETGAALVVAEDRARAAEEEAEQTRRGRAPAPERIALADAASLARRLSARLDELTAPDIAPNRPARSVPAEPEAEPPSATPTADRIVERRGAEQAGPRPAARIPVGLRADTAEGIDALLRTPRLVVVVDGSAAAALVWSEESVDERRKRLVAALRALHARYRCDLDAVFSVDEGEPVGRVGRPGVRAVFSAAGESVGAAMARQVAAIPATVPVLAVCSDPRLAAEAGRHGATVIAVEPFRAVLGA